LRSAYDCEKEATAEREARDTRTGLLVTIYFHNEWFLPILRQIVIRNHVFIVKFQVIVVVYVATSLVNKDKG